jgi:hypothetical protein
VLIAHQFFIGYWIFCGADFYLPLFILGDLISFCSDFRSQIFPCFLWNCQGNAFWNLFDWLDPDRRFPGLQNLYAYPYLLRKAGLSGDRFFLIFFSSGKFL